MTDDERRRDALRMLGRVERRERLHRQRVPHRFDLAEGWARRGRGDLAHVPPGLLPRTPRPDAAAYGQVRTASRADLVRFGKFDRSGTTRVRAFLDVGRPLSIKLQTEHAGDGHGVVSEVGARREAHRLVPGLAPVIVAAGQDDRVGFAWLVEETVAGKHPFRAEEVDRVADRVIGAVARLYRASGFRSRPVADVVSPAFTVRLHAAAASDDRIAAYLDVAARLLLDGREVEVAFAHGDLVGSNVLVRPDGDVQLLDWEHARELLVAADVGKVLLQAGDTPAALASIERHLGAEVGRPATSLPLHDQLVLAQLQGLSWFAHRRQRAESAGRLASFERDLERRLRTLEVLVS